MLKWKIGWNLGFCVVKGRCMKQEKVFGNKWVVVSDAAVYVLEERGSGNR